MALDAVCEVGDCCADDFVATADCEGLEICQYQFGLVLDLVFQMLCPILESALRV